MAYGTDHPARSGDTLAPSDAFKGFPFPSPAAFKPPLVMNEGSRIDSIESLRFLLQSLFETAELEGLLGEMCSNLWSKKDQLHSHDMVALFAHQFLIEKLNGSQGLHAEALGYMKQVVEHLSETAENRRAYSVEGKLNPSAVFWPDPTHPKHPRTIFEEIPYAQLHPFVDKSTPIGSAGSCFAMEIAHRFQANGFNYVVTEPYTTHNKSGKGYSDACAAWGIIFNVPSLRQLVEKSFGVRRLPKLLWYHNDAKKFCDPFREDILFNSVEDYEADYEKHLAACRQAFTRCKAFVMTLGLNEVWTLKNDGTVMSRAPWGVASSLVRRKVMTVEENVNELQRMLDVWKHFVPDIKLIVTVSPVPLHATFRGNEQHVISSTCFSKSVLRVAADTFQQRNKKNVFYFPSYETVMYCTKDPWEPDQRHVERHTVDNVMRLFDTMFIRK